MTIKGAGEAKGESIFLTQERDRMVTSLTTTIKLWRQSNLGEHGKVIN